MDDAYLRERATDLLDLGRRILAKLLREQSESFEYPDDLILVAEDVTPVMLGEVATRSLEGDCLSERFCKFPCGYFGS